MKSEKTGAIDDRARPMLYRPFFWIIALAVAAFAAVPLFGNNVELRESLLLAAVYITLASNLNIMLGYAGYINFGSVVLSPRLAVQKKTTPLSLASRCAITCSTWLPAPALAITSVPTVGSPIM